MLQNVTTECNYHQMLSNQMTEKESWKMILSKFLLNNQISSNQTDDQSDKKEPQTIQKEPDPKEKMKEDHQICTKENLKSSRSASRLLGGEKTCDTPIIYPDPLTPISSNTQASTNTTLRPKSSISQESWPNTSDDGSNASRQTPDSSLEEYSTKNANEFTFNDSVNENKPKFLRSLLAGDDPNQVRSFSSLLTSRVAMASHFDAILNANRLSEIDSTNLKQTRALMVERNNNIQCETNNIDEMLLYLLKFLRKKMESINEPKGPSPNDDGASGNSLEVSGDHDSSAEDDGSLLSSLISEDSSSNFNKLPNLNTYDTYILSGISLNDLRVTRKKISDEYSCLFKVAGTKTMISKNLEAKLTILDLVRTNTKLVFEKINKSHSVNSRMKLPKWIVDLFEGVLDERFTIINNDKKIFDLLQSAVISQDCYPKIITRSCSTIMDNLRDYLLEIGSGERFIDYLLFMTNLNSINYYHIQTLYNSIFPFNTKSKKEETPERIQLLFNQNLPLEHRRKRRASRQFNDQENS